MKAFIIKATTWVSSKDSNNTGTTYTVRTSGRVFTVSTLDFVDDEGKVTIPADKTASDYIELGNVQRVKGDVMPKLVPACSIEWDE
jgi:hypothetical protein